MYDGNKVNNKYFDERKTFIEEIIRTREEAKKAGIIDRNTESFGVRQKGKNFIKLK